MPWEIIAGCAGTVLVGFMGGLFTLRWKRGDQAVDLVGKLAEIQEAAQNGRDECREELQGVRERVVTLEKIAQDHEDCPRKISALERQVESLRLLSLPPPVARTGE